jgi:hypothetical protein
LPRDHAVPGRGAAHQPSVLNFQLRSAAVS